MPLTISITVGPPPLTLAKQKPQNAEIAMDVDSNEVAAIVVTTAPLLEVNAVAIPQSTDDGTCNGKPWILRHAEGSRMPRR